MKSGYFPPGAITRRITSERALLFGGPRALVLQLAHPLVAAGVGEHSGFAADPLSRLRRTLDSTLAIVFGTRDEADAAAAKINNVHGFVHGVLPEDAGRYTAGTTYDARDPELLLWVHATLVDTSFLVYERYVGTLTPRELDDAYEESKLAARLLGVTDELIPKDLAQFRSYVADMIASDRISAAPFQRALVREVLYPKISVVPRKAFWPAVAVTTDLLPPRVRELYGLRRSRSVSLVSNWSRVVVRGMLPVAPKRLRYQPPSR